MNKVENELSTELSSLYFDGILTFFKTIDISRIQ